MIPAIGHALQLAFCMFWEVLWPLVLGFALSAAHHFPGVHENNRGIGRHAADLLVSLVLRNERGIPAMRQTVLVEPSLESPPGTGL